MDEKVLCHHSLNKFYKTICDHIKILNDKNEITLFDGSRIGIKTIDNKSININHLVEDSDIILSSSALGLYIPQEELEERTRYNWITYISNSELLNSNTFMGKTFNKHLHG